MSLTKNSKKDELGIGFTQFLWKIRFFFLREGFSTMTANKEKIQLRPLVDSISMHEKLGHVTALCKINKIQSSLILVKFHFVKEKNTKF